MHDLELARVAAEIKKRKAKSVLVQLPDGLKPKAEQIADFLKEHTSAKIFIWAGSCYGACDIPDVKGIDLLIHYGHSEWK